MLKNISLNVARGEVVVICGPSGSGKSTLIRTINQLERVQEGEIIVDSIPILRKGVDLNYIRQRMGFVFQQFNLFPHMSVLENVTFAPMYIKYVPRSDAVAFARQLLERVGLLDKMNAYPAALSGGQ